MTAPYKCIQNPKVFIKNKRWLSDPDEKLYKLLAGEGIIFK